MKYLFLCSREEEETYIENNCICTDTKDIVFATTNYQYYRKNVKKGNKIIFLEPDENTPYEDIWEILNQVNYVINDCQLDNSLVYMSSYHYEDYLPRTLSAMILNLHLVDKIVEEYSVEHFFIVDDKDNWKINEAIFLYAISKNIICTIIDDVTGRKKECLFTLKKSAYDKSSKENKKYKELETEEEKRIELWMRKERKPLHKNRQNLFQVGVLYCDRDCAKQIKWMKQLLKILGKNVVVISFYNSQDNEAFEEYGYTVHCVEDYFDQFLFTNQYNKFKADRERILQAIENNLSITYEGINISYYLYRKLVNYFYREVLEYIYIYNCTYKYFEVNGFKIVSAWGTSNFWQTRICYLNSRNYSTRFFYISRTSAVAWKNYEPWEDIVPIRVYPNGYPAEQRTSNQFKGESYYFFDVLGGIDYYEKKLLSENKYMPKIVKIAFLPSYPLEGRKTFCNYENNCKVIIGELSQCECIINFKNHPGMNQYLDEEIKERYKHIVNFNFIDKFESGDAVIQDSDLVITDGSLVIFDAASYQKPVFIMAAGSDYELIKQHKEGFIICRTPEDLCTQILVIIKDKKYDQRIKEIIEKQNRYLESLFGEYDSNAEQVIAQMIRDKV